MFQIQLKINKLATKHYVDVNTWSLAGNTIAATNKLGSTNDVDLNIIRNNSNRIVCKCYFKSSC